MRRHKILTSLFIAMILFSLAWAEETYLVSEVVERFETGSWRVGGMNFGPRTGAQIVSKPVWEGQGSLELSYEFTGQPANLVYCEYYKSVPLSGEKFASLSMWVHGDGSGHKFYVRLRDGSGETIQYSGGNLNWQGWEKVTFDLTKPFTHWGGDNDGVLTAPVSLESIIIDTKDKSLASYGRIYLDEMVVLSEVPASKSLLIEVGSDKVGNIFTEEDEIEFQIKLRNISSKNRDLDIYYWVTSTTDRAISSGSMQVNVPKESTKVQNLSFQVPINGNFKLRLYVTSKDRAIRLDQEFPFSRIVTPPETRNPIFAVCTHHGLERGDPPKNNTVASLSGTYMIRDEMIWGRAEREKGKFEIQPMWDFYVNDALAKNLQVFLILDYGNKFYDEGGAPYTEEGIAAFVRYATFLAEHFKGRINHFEVWNEYNMEGGGFNPTSRPPEDYARLLKAVYPAIKEVNPDAFIVGCCTAGTDLGWIKRVFDAGGYDYMDAVSIHPYCYPTSPDEGGIVKNIELTRELMLQYGEEKPIWLTEVGWPTQEDQRGVSEIVSGAYAVRLHALGMAAGADKIFWYDLQDDGTDRTYNEHNFGLIKTWFGLPVPWAAKDNFIAYSAMTKKMADVEYVDAYDEGNLKIYRFRSKTDNKDLLILWTLRGIETIGLKLGADRVLATDLWGNPFYLSATSGVITTSVTPFPIYLEGFFQGIEITEPFFDVGDSSFATVAGETITINLKVPKNCDLAGSLMADLPAGWSLVGDTSFTGETNDCALTLRSSGQSELGDYEVFIYPVRGQEVLARLSLNVQLVEPLQLSVSPELVDRSRWDKWNLVLSLTNNSTTQVLDGTVSLQQPLEWAKATQPITFSGLEPRTTQKISIPIPQEIQGTADLTFAVSLTQGYYGIVNTKTSFLAAVKASQPIVLDGDLSEWQDAMPFAMNQAWQVKQIPDWGGPSDLSGVGYLKWDQDYLYLALNVTDNVHRQDDTGSATWKGDGIQFAIDPGFAELPGKYGHHEIGVALHETGETNWRWLAAYGMDVGEIEGLECTIVRSGNNTIYELAIPWSELLKDQAVEPGLVVGFSLLVNDNDGTGRRGWIEYNSGIGLAKDPSMFGDLLLIE